MVASYGPYTSDNALIDLFEDIDGISVRLESENFFICLNEEILDDDFGIGCDVKTQVRTNNFANTTVKPVENFNIFIMSWHILRNVIREVCECIRIG